MINGKSIVLIIPCHNEVRGLLEMLPKVPDFIDEVVIVDNFSTDGTWLVAEKYGCTVWNEVRRGYGATYKLGFRNVQLYRNYDIIVTMDGDTTYPLDEVERIIRLLLDNDVDFISCNRFPLTDKKSMHIFNRLGNRMLALLTSVLFGRYLADSQTGMWVFKRRVLDYIFPQANDMTMTLEIKLLVMSHPKLKFRETHISYGSRIGGTTKMRRWVDGLRNLKLLFRMRCK